MSLKIYNTLTRKKEVFKPLYKKFVGMYVCGPTVYGDPHLGHARPAITFDIVFRYLNFLGYNVRYVRNITDAGHLENDGDSGEDKIVKKARLEQLEPMEIVELYSRKYHASIKKLNCLPPSIEPRATGHIIEQIEMIKGILKKGFAYEKNGSVYLDVSLYNQKYPYGKLSGRNIEDTLEGTRKLDSQQEKKNPIDFALWKKASKGHIMQWPSPWGNGFPGWHMECSAMSEKYLGKTFDIHGGGMDLIFPHHEAEIAQSNAFHNCEPAKYWMHNNMVTIEGQKMGKSLNNFINLDEFFSGEHDKLNQAYHPMTIRFFILQAHYRNPIDFSNEALQASEKGLKKLLDAYSNLRYLKANNTSTYCVEDLKNKCLSAINDDFNTPMVISHLFEGVKVINLMGSGEESLNSEDLDKIKSLFHTFLNIILGISNIDEKSKSNQTDNVMDIVLRIRDNAREKKDWGTADFIRDELNKIGIEIKDEKDKAVWKYK